MQKKTEKSNDGKYENFCHGQTDGRTDGAGRAGPKNQEEAIQIIT